MTGQGGRWLMAALLLCGGATTAAAFSFEEMDRIDQAEQGELLEAARKAAGQEDFDRARSLIEQARNKRYAPQAVAGVEKLVREAWAARDERLRREEQARLAQAEAEAERRAREQARVDGSGNKGGVLNCAIVSSNYGLWDYCERGRCEGFSGNYPLWTLCEKNDAGGLSSNYAVWSYLTKGDPSGFSKDYRAWSAASKQAGSFADRKRFIIFYLNGYIYE